MKMSTSKLDNSQYCFRNDYDLVYLSGRRLPWTITKFDRQLSQVLDKKKIAPPLRVLDLGCGTGKNMRYLQRKGFEVVGIDFSHQALNLARTRRRKVKSFLVLGDASRLPFKNNTFDSIIDVGCFHCFPPRLWNASRDEVWRLLKSNGRYFLKLWYNQQGTSDASRPMFWLNKKIPIWGFNMDLVRSVFF